MERTEQPTTTSGPAGQELRSVVESLFRSKGLAVPADRLPRLERFLGEERNKALLDVIMQTGDLLMAGWKIEERMADLVQQPVRIPNATVGKVYTATLDVDALGWQDLTDTAFEGLEEIGLNYDSATKTLSGTPVKSGEFPLRFLFRVEGQPDDAAFAEKTIPLTINPDPKSLWKNVESDRADPYWKEDNVTVFAPLGDRHILVSSKRGRSHANVGGFREDDFAFASLAGDWQLVAVADGAGSAKYSRKGSVLACAAVVDAFNKEEAAQNLASFDDLLQRYQQGGDADAEKELKRFVYTTLGKAAFGAHKTLEAFAKENGLGLKDLSTTLIFTLWKKFESGYAFLSFGVGDCPIALLTKNVEEVLLLNWLDVGEFGGGTRFITMPEIFSAEKFATRFSFKLVPDFEYLLLMSDGIYDPKFVVEAALPKVEKWRELLADLGGNNSEGTKVDLRADNENIEAEFSAWMDFWSPGNHDDRTLAIVF